MSTTKHTGSPEEQRILPTIAELRDNGESDPEAAIIFQALGAASTCWESMEGTGVFQSDRAKRIGDELLYELRAIPAEQEVETLRAEVERLRKAGDAMLERLKYAKCPTCEGSGIMQTGRPNGEGGGDAMRMSVAPCTTCEILTAVKEAWTTAKELNVTPSER